MNKEEAYIAAKQLLDNCNQADGCPYCALYTLEEVAELFFDAQMVITPLN
jgi:hypothetical protein